MMKTFLNLGTNIHRFSSFQVFSILASYLELATPNQNFVESLREIARTAMCGNSPKYESLVAQTLLNN